MLTYIYLRHELVDLDTSTPEAMTSDMKLGGQLRGTAIDGTRSVGTVNRSTTHTPQDS